ncbi:Cu(I)-responsive transcriptional regulator [Rheinheimera sp. A13L]|uniref:Cu(I)-responsive transcriptional regulator n=1 Tax=Rheinheimera sp. A13L TaxID=506534 RepID=UPI0002124F76|nr:Cu(I)-responsive transcriptional regulator [Rheinheimera sp. A13L]EGM79217.1 Cu(I)-responsive transcriptional regulator [Rheinheimera sp. A13L]
MANLVNTLVTIGQAAKQTGLSAKMIRYYEEAGLLLKANRTDAGYRLYNNQQLQQLGFIKQARALGFSIVQISSLLGLWRDPNRSSREVKQLAELHLDEIKQKVAELQQMQSLLQQLADSCCGDDQPQCAILDGLQK